MLHVVVEAAVTMVIMGTMVTTETEDTSVVPITVRLSIQMQFVVTNSNFLVCERQNFLEVLTLTLYYKA